MFLYQEGKLNLWLNIIIVNDVLCIYIYIYISGGNKNIYISILFGCWSFMSFQHLRAYQDGYCFVTMPLNGNVIMAP